MSKKNNGWELRNRHARKKSEEKKAYEFSVDFDTRVVNAKEIGELDINDFAMVLFCLAQSLLVSAKKFKDTGDVQLLKEFGRRLFAEEDILKIYAEEDGGTHMMS